MGPHRSRHAHLPHHFRSRKQAHNLLSDCSSVVLTIFLGSWIAAKTMTSTGRMWLRKWPEQFPKHCLASSPPFLDGPNSLHSFEGPRFRYSLDPRTRSQRALPEWPGALFDLFLTFFERLLDQISRAHHPARASTPEHSSSSFREGPRPPAQSTLCLIWPILRACLAGSAHYDPDGGSLRATSSPLGLEAALKESLTGRRARR